MDAQLGRPQRDSTLSRAWTICNHNRHKSKNHSIKRSRRSPAKIKTHLILEVRRNPQQTGHKYQTELSLLFAAFASLSLLLFGFRGVQHILALLGASIGALLTLLVQNRFGSKKLDESLLSAVAALEATAHNAQIAAVAVAVARGYRVKKPRDCIAGLKERKRLTPRMQVALLAQGDQLLHVWTHSLRLGDGRLYAVFENNGRDQVPQQSAAVAGVAS